MSSVMRFDEWQDSNGVPVASGVGGVFTAPGSILQVVSTTKTDTFSMSSTTFADVTGLSVSITPSSTSSKIFVVATGNVASQPGVVAHRLRLMRDSTAIAVAAAAGSRVLTSSAGISNDANNPNPFAVNHIDSPGTTSAVLYKIQLAANGANAVYINRSHNDSDNSSTARAVSSITVMEVAA